MVPENWSYKEVGDLCDFVNGNGFKSSEWSDSGLPIIRIQNLNGSDNFNYYLGEPKEKWLVNSGDILFAWAGTKGVSFGAKLWNGPTGVLNQHIFRVVPKVDLDSSWLFIALLRVTQRVEEMAHGFKATLVHVQKSDILGQKIGVPPLPEQRKIAKILRTWDRAIATTEKLIDASKQQKKALMQQLLTGKKRFSGFEGERSKRAGFAQKKLGALPDDWVLVNVAERYWFQEGPGVRKHQFTESGIKLLNGTNIQKSRINLGNTNTHIAESEGNGPYAHFLADAGDLVIACSGISVDRFDEKIAFLDKSHLPLCMNTSTMRFKVKSEESETADIEYLRYFLMSTAFKNQIRRQITGSAQLNFGPSHVERCFIPMPTMLEQRKIARALNSIDNELDRSEERLRFLKQEKKALMQQLLTGKRRVKVDAL